MALIYNIHILFSADQKFYLLTRIQLSIQL